MGTFIMCQSSYTNNYSTFIICHFSQTLPAYSHHLLKSGVCLKVSIYCMVDKCCSSSDCIFLWKVCAVLFGYSNVMKFH